MLKLNIQHRSNQSLQATPFLNTAIIPIGGYFVILEPK
jgi:hypothetical protein